MANKKTPYLDFYTRCMETGFIPEGHEDGNNCGLCGILGSGVMSVFEPTSEDCQEYDVRYWGYWANDEVGLLVRNLRKARLGFGPTRQNIVLLLAAMNGEL